MHTLNFVPRVSNFSALSPREHKTLTDALVQAGLLEAPLPDVCAYLEVMISALFHVEQTGPRIISIWHSAGGDFVGCLLDYDPTDCTPFVRVSPAETGPRFVHPETRVLPPVEAAGNN